MRNNTNAQSVQPEQETIIDSPTFAKPSIRRPSTDTITMESEQEKRSEEEGYPSSPSRGSSALGLFCQSLAQSFDGDFVKKFEQKEIFVFLCAMGHKFMLTKKQVLAGSWCTGCAKTLANVRRFAVENKGEVLGQRLTRTLQLRCQQGHSWEASYKKAALKWCRECSRSGKRLLKDMITQETKRIEEEKRVQQVS